MKEIHCTRVARENEKRVRSAESGGVRSAESGEVMVCGLGHACGALSYVREPVMLVTGVVCLLVCVKKDDIVIDLLRGKVGAIKA